MATLTRLLIVGVILGVLCFPFVVKADGTDVEIGIDAGLPGAPTNLLAVANDEWSIGLTWTEGVGATHTYIVRKVGSYPTSRTDGVIIYDGTGDNCTDIVDVSYKEYTLYYRAWSRNLYGYSVGYTDEEMGVSEDMMTLGIFGFLGLAVFTIGVVSKKWPMALASVFIWLPFGIWNAAEAAGGGWLTLNGGMAVFCAIMTLIAIWYPVSMRQKIEAPEEESDYDSLRRDTEEIIAEDDSFNKLYPSRRGKRGRDDV